MSATTTGFILNADQQAINNFCLLLDALPVPCAIFTNKAWLSYANTEFIRSFSSFTGIETFNDFLKIFDQANRNGIFNTITVTEDRNAVLAYCSALGKTYQLHLSSLHCDAEQSLSLLCALDFTEGRRSFDKQRELQEQLMNTARSVSVGEMASVLAHELNQPLGAIINYLNAAKQQLSTLADLPPRLPAAIHHAEIQAIQAAAVITRIREFVSSRDPMPENCHLAEVISQVIELLQLDAHQHCVVIKVDIAPDLPTVCMDRIMITQVITNLIRNGIEAMSATPLSERQMMISASLALENKIKITVRDAGCGISPEAGTKLFTSFFSTKPNGMGIGLSICRTIIEYHGGNLYRDENVLKGTAFVFTLPTMMS